MQRQYNKRLNVQLEITRTHMQRQYNKRLNVQLEITRTHMQPQYNKRLNLNDYKPGDRVWCSTYYFSTHRLQRRSVCFY